VREFFRKRPWLFVVGILLFFVIGNATVLVVAQATQGADLSPLPAEKAGAEGPPSARVAEEQKP